MAGVIESTGGAVVVAPATDEAFRLFTAGFGRWWPPEFSWSGAELLADIGMEPEVGGALWEYGPYRLRWDWGRILTWQPGELLEFTWQIGADRVPVPDPTRAGAVRVDFAPHRAGTRVEVVHGGWERHGAGGAAYRDDFAMAWPYALGRYADLAGIAA